MKYCDNFEIAIAYAHNFLREHGQVMKTESWQGVKSPIAMFEAMDFAFECPMPMYEGPYHLLLTEMIKPNHEWADEHFNERVSGIPYNPAPSHVRWPYGTLDNKAHMKDEVFSHTYPERFWPKYINGFDVDKEVDMEASNIWNTIYKAGKQHGQRGIRYELGDFKDLINLLAKEPHTRQAYLPIWFPEDTGAVQGQRVPCTLGYLFRIVNNKLNITYKIRSCDYYRHFRDDIYMAARLVYYILQKLSQNDSHGFWNKVQPGMFKFQADSFHIFANEKSKL